MTIKDVVAKEMSFWCRGIVTDYNKNRTAPHTGEKGKAENVGEALAALENLPELAADTRVGGTLVATRRCQGTKCCRSRRRRRPRQ